MKSGRVKIAREAYKSYQSCLLTALVIFLTHPASVFAEIGGNLSEVRQPIEEAGRVIPVVGFGIDRTSPAAGSETMPLRSPAGPAPGPQVGKIMKEVGKQAIDQPGHFLIGAAPIWASRYLVGVPWYGWVITPLLAYREWLQWPSKRWWDPPLDWVFLSLGAIVATYRRRSARSLPDGPSPRRRRLARGSSHAWRCGATTPAPVLAGTTPSPGAARRLSLSAAAEAECRR